MVLSNNLDKVKLVPTAVAATAAVPVALESIGLIRSRVMFERYVNVTENIRVERN
ncbi:MAG: hypothetical protein OXU77_03550 [Gammaproteobacteria bacterium]|nr:hypothetical protein [Gammaproteobacteria bacterium]